MDRSVRMEKGVIRDPSSKAILVQDKNEYELHKKKMKPIRNLMKKIDILEARISALEAKYECVT